MREVPTVPARDPLSAAERVFLGGRSEFTYTDDDRATLDALCTRGIISPLPGEFLQEQIAGQKGRTRLRAIYALTQQGATWLSWSPPAPESEAK